MPQDHKRKICSALLLRLLKRVLRVCETVRLCPQPLDQTPGEQAYTMQRGSEGGRLCTVCVLRAHMLLEPILHIHENWDLPTRKCPKPQFTILFIFSGGILICP